LRIFAAQKGSHVGDERFRLGNLGTHLVRVKTHKIGIVALLTPLKQVIVEASQLSGDNTGSDVMAIEEAADACVSGRGASIASKQRGHGVEAAQ
jgi:hypothetical protein